MTGARHIMRHKTFVVVILYVILRQSFYLYLIKIYYNSYVRYSHKSIKHVLKDNRFVR